MLQRFLLTTLLENTLYLGYHKKFTNANMFADILGSRMIIDLHNLNQTLFTFKKVLNLVALIWQRFGILWVITSKSSKTKWTKKVAQLLRKILFIQDQTWVSGFFSNARSFLTASAVNKKFPSGLFYTNYSDNLTHLGEITSAGLVQAGIADTNSTRKGYQYFVNANEKTRSSATYCTSVFTLLAFRTLCLRKKRFVLNRTKSIPNASKAI